ncbi:putative hydrolase C21C3.09c [Fusarium oxysporum f. sp. albedinis]|nr:putative hydrolase C21C3.09c [Fusarium oxysporum f. sp. albedinis]
MVLRTGRTTERPPARSFSEPHLLLICLIFLLFPSDGTYPCSLSGDLAWVAKAPVRDHLSKPQASFERWATWG